MRMTGVLLASTCEIIGLSPFMMSSACLPPLNKSLMPTPWYETEQEYCIQACEQPARSDRSVKTAINMRRPQQATRQELHCVTVCNSPSDKFTSLD